MRVDNRRTGRAVIVESGWGWEADIRLDQPWLGIVALYMGVIKAQEPGCVPSTGRMRVVA